MSGENEKFESLRGYLSRFPLFFCLVFRGEEAKDGVELKWCKAIAPDKKTREEYDKLAAKFRAVAMHCFQHRRNLILKENIAGINSRTPRWCGLNIPTETDENLLPANSLGQRWWHVVVGAGPTRSAGFVIVARIAVKETKELHNCIAHIQKIIDEGKK
jgi:hypothetical protein